MKRFAQIERSAWVFRFTPICERGRSERRCSSQIEARHSAQQALRHFFTELLQVVVYQCEKMG